MYEAVLRLRYGTNGRPRLVYIALGSQGGTLEVKSMLAPCRPSNDGFEYRLDLKSSIQILVDGYVLLQGRTCSIREYDVYWTLGKSPLFSVGLNGSSGWRTPKGGDGSVGVGFLLTPFLGVRACVYAVVGV